jgi:hypothetical protein
MCVAPPPLVYIVLRIKNIMHTSFLVHHFSNLYPCDLSRYRDPDVLSQWWF